MFNLGSLFVKIGADPSQFHAAMGQVQAESKATAAVVNSQSMLIAGGLLAIGAAALGAANDVQKAHATIRVGTGATGEELKRLKADFDVVFGTVPQDAEQVGKAIADLNTRRGTAAEDVEAVPRSLPHYRYGP